MVDEHGAPEEAHDQPAPSREEEAAHRQHDGGHQRPALQPHQLAVARQVGNGVHFRLRVLRIEDPAHVRVEEAAHPRGVRVQLRVRVAVVVAVDGGPPERPALCRALRDPGEHELAGAARLERAV